jgi:hypothetical protein
MHDQILIENQLKYFEKQFNLTPKYSLLSSLETMRYGLSTSNLFMIIISFPPLNVMSHFFEEALN